jgi:RNA polymerase sigma factor (sigma-70 family)
MMTTSRRHQRTNRNRLADDDVKRLVARAADGDQTAWNALVDEFGGLLRATTRAHRLSDEDAADVCQTTWMRLVENLESIQDPTRLGSWLATTARRECLGVIRRAARLIPQSDDLLDHPSEEPDPSERLITEQSVVAIHAALNRLGPRHRALLRMLAAVPAPSYAEIGATLGMAIGSIGPTRARALARLRSEAAQTGLMPLARAVA